MTDSYDDHTLVITTFNRPRYLYRLLSYIAQDLPVGRVRVVDGSLEPSRTDNRTVVEAFADRMPVTLEQLEPGIDVLAHHRYAYCCADTPFMTFCHDDNFCVPSAIRESVEFLRDHPGHVNCSGMMAGIRRENDRTTVFLSDVDRLEQEEPLERLAHFLANHWSADFGTWRSEARRLAVSAFDLYHLDEAIGEPMSCGISALLGKFHLLSSVSIVFCVHDSNRGGGSTERKSSLVRPEFSQTLSVVADFIAGFCRENAVTPPEDGRAFYLTAYLRYMSKWWHQFRELARGQLKSGETIAELAEIENRAESALLEVLLRLPERQIAEIRELQHDCLEEADPSKGELFVVKDRDVILADIPVVHGDPCTVLSLPVATALPEIYRGLRELLLQEDWPERYDAFFEQVACDVLGSHADDADARLVFDAACLGALVKIVRPLHRTHPLRVNHMARALGIDQSASPDLSALLRAVSHFEACPSPSGSFEDTQLPAIDTAAEGHFTLFYSRPLPGSLSLPFTTGTVTKNQSVVFIPLQFPEQLLRLFNAGHQVWLCVAPAVVRGRLQFSLYGDGALDLLVPVSGATGVRELYFPIRTTNTEYLVMRDITWTDGPGSCSISRIWWMVSAEPHMAPAMSGSHAAAA